MVWVFVLTQKSDEFLYGLKQSPRQWYKCFDQFMIEHDYVRSPYDNCVSHEKIDGGFYTYLHHYVDNMLIAALDESTSKLEGSTH